MAADISERIKAVYSTLSKGQKKIANAVLNDYDKVAYLTAAKLGDMVGVSESTVVRFADELGFEGYSQFQLAVQELVRIKLTPNQRIEITKQRIGRGDVIDKAMESDISKIKYTLEHLDRRSFSEAVDAILGAKNIYITGARSSEPLARLLSYNLSLIFDNVKLVVPTSSAEVFEQMYSVSQDDVVIAFSFPRYSSKMINGIRFARRNNAKVVVFTDSNVSPIAEFAHCVLIAQSDMASFMDSLVAPLSIINAIVIEITHRREREITERFDALEKLWDEYEVYAKR
ncbi:MAG: MurR/RpiR family transcriptional regulator [Clostridia bacterium]|nr:MurR/RpiR family transcriptional regulator [Clostridia bacterium]MBR3876517.1 MurR/RpiR family transcriptional regulator [Clostridia bacterium]